MLDGGADEGRLSAKARCAHVVFLPVTSWHEGIDGPASIEALPSRRPGLATKSPKGFTLPCHEPMPLPTQAVHPSEYTTIRKGETSNRYKLRSCSIGVAVFAVEQSCAWPLPTHAWP